MAEPKTHSVAEFLAAVKPKLEKLATDIRVMRERELAKHGKPCDVCAELKCSHKLQKNLAEHSTPGSGIPSDTGMGSTGGGGTQPMGKKELAKCGDCGKAHSMGKCDLSEVKPGKDLTKDAGGLADVGTMSKASMPSSSAAALAPPKARPATPVGQVAHEMGSFTSLAHSPVGPGASGHLASSPMAARKPIAQMGRPSLSGNVKTSGSGGTAPVAVSGTIPNAKSEPGTGSKYGTGGPGHANQSSMPSSLKENMAPTAKAEKELARVPAAPEAAVEGSKMPKAGKSVDSKKTGSGGQLKKDAMAMQRAPEGAGVGGKQPVGMGGGDAHKIAGWRPAPAKAPDLGALPGGKPKSVDVDVSEFDKGPAKPSEKAGSALQAAGRGEVKRLIAEKGPAGNPNAPAGGGLQAAGNAEVARMGGGQAANDKATLQHDLKAGGVGWLHSLLTRLNPGPTAAELGSKGVIPKQQGQASSARFHGTTALRRSEKPAGLSKAAMELAKMGKCAMCKEAEHPGLCKGLTMNHNRTMLSVSTKKTKSKKSR